MFSVFSILFVFTFLGSVSSLFSTRLNGVYKRDNYKNDDLVTQYSRFAFMAVDINLGMNATPPTPAQIAASVEDPNHTYMLSTKLYNQTQIDAFDNESFMFFDSQFGINFFSGIPLGNGVITQPPFVLIPYATNVYTSFHVIFDSGDIQSGATGDTYAYQFGYVLFCNANGRFSSGTHMGDSYVNGSVLTFFKLNFLRTGGAPPNSTQHRQEFLVRTPWVSQNVPNSQGYTDSITKGEIVDSTGNIGFYDENIMYVKEPNTDEVYNRIRVTVTWN